MVQQTLDTPTDLFHFQLRTAVTMEDDSLTALGELADAATSAEVKKLFRHHADETKQQQENLTKVFAELEWKPTTAPSPSTKGISRQAESLLERSGGSLRDHAAVACALGNEHYEISAYEGLILPAEAMGWTTVAKLLRENLDQETHTSEELRSMLQKIVG